MQITASTTTTDLVVVLIVVAVTTLLLALIEATALNFSLCPLVIRAQWRKVRETLS